jgi:hypothetical protein
VGRREEALQLTEEVVTVTKRRLGDEPWKDRYGDLDGCLTLSTAAGEGHEIWLHVKRVPLRGVRLVPPHPPPKAEASEDEEKEVMEISDDNSDERPSSDEGEEEGEEEEE